ncbi:MAG: hypothetical protein WCA76_08890 [Candidatus Sulfotelmatobacter sp.]|jgi:hypothetical protein
METGFSFEVKWRDADLLEIRISGWNGAFGGSTDVYVPIGGLKNAATKVEGFPRHPLDKRELQFGVFGHKWAGGAVNMLFYCADAAGHALIEAKIESEHGGTPKAESALFFVSVEASAIDRFVADLRRLEADQSGTAILKAS